MKPATYTAYRSKLGGGIVRKQTPAAPSTVLTNNADWGNHSHHCFELAALLLRHAYGSPVTERAAFIFMEHILSRLPYEGWTLEPSEENKWIAHGTRETA